MRIVPGATSPTSRCATAGAPHATLSIAHSFGTLAQGGGDFESVYAMISLYRRDDIAGVEVFELDDLDAAWARFEELRPRSQT